jgi:hypothetical protein
VGTGERGMRFGSYTELHISLIFWECDFLISVFFFYQIKFYILPQINSIKEKYF